MRQCSGERCRFRFPAPAGTTEGHVCPRCQSPTAFVTAPFSGRPPETASPAGPHVEALLDNIRSIFNVGAMFRTADGAGIRRLHLAGITATPDHPKVAKTALGAERAVAWSEHPNGLDAATALRERGYRLWALESTARSTNLFDTRPAAEGAPILLIAGNELAGVDPQILALCQRTVHLPMEGVKGSLNVAIAFGVAAYYLRYSDR